MNYLNIQQRFFIALWFIGDKNGAEIVIKLKDRFLNISWRSLHA